MKAKPSPLDALIAEEAPQLRKPKPPAWDGTPHVDWWENPETFYAQARERFGDTTVNVPTPFFISGRRRTK